MSLRARLVLGLLGVATVGLLLLASVTYVEQRRFLLERVDGQARGGVQVVGARMSGEGLFDRRFDDGGRPPGGGGGPGGPGGSPEAGIAAGLYGEQRTASGLVLARTVLRFAEEAPSPPRLPAVLRPGQYLTVPARDGSLDYRVYVSRTPDRVGGAAAGGVTVAAVPLTEADATLDRLLLVEGLVIAGVLLLLAAVAWLLVGIGLRPLERIGRTADEIAAGELSRRIEGAGARTEVGRLGTALNAMLGRIEGAFAGQRASEERLRRFLSDAAHELRTPLASIRGYAELFRIGAVTGPEDTAKAMDRIEQESARMGVLVEDLLTLARLDEVRDVGREEVDLAVLAGGVVQDGRAMAPDREIGLDARGPIGVEGDPHRLHQVLANLVRNAIVHTPAGTPIEVRVARGGIGPDGARIEVRDHGPGLPGGDGEALFERFWRDTEARGRGPAGAGLGLAIVAGVVRAHGGAVTAEDAEGGGARFVVDLPAEPPQDDGAAERPGGLPPAAEADGPAADGGGGPSAGA